MSSASQRSWGYFEAAGAASTLRSDALALTPPEGTTDLTNHLVLLELSRDEEGRSRLVTTNFDTLFERAWWERHSQQISSHAGTAMPRCCHVNSGMTARRVDWLT
jgi:hypothetical protein